LHALYYLKRRYFLLFFLKRKIGLKGKLQSPTTHASIKKPNDLAQPGPGIGSMLRPNNRIGGNVFAPKVVNPTSTH